MVCKSRGERWCLERELGGGSHGVVGLERVRNMKGSVRFRTKIEKQGKKERLKDGF